MPAGRASESVATTVRAPGSVYEFDEAQLAAVSFLARYSGRTLEAYRHDLRGFFQWADGHGLAVMRASRAHIELFRAWMEGPRARGVDDRPSALDGLWLLSVRAHRRAHPREPRPVRPQTPGPRIDARGLDRSEVGMFPFTADQYDRDHAALAVLLGSNGLRVSEACATNVQVTSMSVTST
jgi:integrase/recombinase XerD